MDKLPNIYASVMDSLRSKRISQRAVAAGSGVPFSTVTKIAQGQIKSPRVHQVQALYDFFQSDAVRAGSSADTAPEPMKEAA